MFKGSYLFQPIVLGIHVSFRGCSYSWWLNQPIWKICASPIESSPQPRVENIQISPTTTQIGMYIGSQWIPWRLIFRSMEKISGKPWLHILQRLNMIWFSSPKFPDPSKVQIILNLRFKMNIWHIFLHLSSCWFQPLWKIFVKMGSSSAIFVVK